jgi:hypothetical protein
MDQDGKFSAPGRVTNDFRELAPIRQARLPWPLGRNGLKSLRLECGHTRALDSVVLRLSSSTSLGKMDHGTLFLCQLRSCGDTCQYQDVSVVQKTALIAS